MFELLMLLGFFAIGLCHLLPESPAPSLGEKEEAFQPPRAAQPASNPRHGEPGNRRDRCPRTGPVGKRRRPEHLCKARRLC